MADIKAIIKDIEGGFGTSDDDRGKILSLFKGLIFSDDPLAKEFMKKLDTATTSIAKGLGKKDESIEVKKDLKDNFLLSEQSAKDFLD